jgi:VWFA-related protein
VKFLQDLSDTTGGRFYRSEIADLSKNFALIVDELRQQYVIGYYPASDKKSADVHEIKVEVTRPDAVVRARQNYREKKA